MQSKMLLSFVSSFEVCSFLFCFVLEGCLFLRLRGTAGESVCVNVMREADEGTWITYDCFGPYDIWMVVFFFVIVVGRGATFRIL